MDFSVLAARDCLVAFAAVVLCSDHGVEAHKMGYDHGGIAHLTAKGAASTAGPARSALAYLRVGQRPHDRHSGRGAHQVQAFEFRGGAFDVRGHHGQIQGEAQVAGAPWPAVMVERVPEAAKDSSMALLR
jgi:hypothetical protein